MAMLGPYGRDSDEKGWDSAMLLHICTHVSRNDNSDRGTPCKCLIELMYLQRRDSDEIGAECLGLLHMALLGPYGSNSDEKRIGFCHTLAYLHACLQKERF